MLWEIMPKYAVVACSDKHMLPAACCSLLSVDQTAGKDRAVYYLVGIDLDAQDHADIASFTGKHGIKIEIVPYTTPDNLRATQGRWSSATLARLFLDQLLPSDIDRVLYIDADVLAVSPIDALWSVDLKGNIVGAVEDYLMAFPAKAKRRETRLGLKNGPAYFNAGVILFSWRACLEQDLFGRSREIMTRGDVQLDANDQDILNIACQGRWMPLDHGWNVQTGLMPFVRSKFIVHFTGRRKPWQHSRPWRHRTFSKFYQNALHGIRWNGFAARHGIFAEIRDFLLSCAAYLGDLKRQGKARSYFTRDHRASS